MMTGGLEGLIREPSGCFEQTSSSNYPNVMILDFLQSNQLAAPDLIARTQKKLDRGYRKLVGYETKEKGYEWFGSTPAHEALTAYGVLQFEDMKAVYGSVDNEMVTRTVNYLKTRRDGKGGFKRSRQALDSFGRASKKVTNAYITWAISMAGLGRDFDREVKAQLQQAQKSNDAYMIALVANTLLQIPSYKKQANQLVKKLAKMQNQQGAWSNADHSITRSTGHNLHIETTSLALLALMKHKKYKSHIRKGIKWLNTKRGGFGRWGATQATILALKAMTEYIKLNRMTESSGQVELWIDQQLVTSIQYQKGRKDPIVLSSTGETVNTVLKAYLAQLTSDKHSIELRHKGKSQLPYTLAVTYRSPQPASHAQAPIQIQTKLAKNKVKMGENVRLTATITNTSKKGQPMTIARVGFPGGLTYQTWQLKELKEKGMIAFYETRAREVILYFRSLAPEAVKEIPLELVAMVPGTYQGPASQTYLYYSDDRKHWDAGVKVQITP